jgi:hypothetical protein
MEDQEEYVKDALEMMGIMEPKQIITEVSGFIPVFEVVLHHYKDYMTALVFGRMWQYCGMSDGVCKASLDRIGNDLEISATTVMRHAEKLVEDKYLIDTTPDRRNAPHEYIDGRRVEMKSRFTAGIAESRPTVIKSDATVIKSQLIKQDNTILNNNDLTEEEKAQVNKAMDERLAMANFPGAKREARVNSILSYLGETFHKNVETKEWREFAKYVDGEHTAKGWDIKRFIEWLYGQKNFDLQYWPVKKMRENYPAAFADDVAPERTESSGYYA